MGGGGGGGAAVVCEGGGARWIADLLINTIFAVPFATRLSWWGFDHTLDGHGQGDDTHGHGMRFYHWQSHCVSGVFDLDGATPLHRAAASGSLVGVEVFLSHGVEVNGLDKNGRSAVDVAEAMRQWDLVTFLEGRGGKRSDR